MIREKPSMAQVDYVWHPSEKVRQESNWSAFLRDIQLPSYEALAAKASADPSWFWDALIQHIDFRFYRPYAQVLDLSGGIEFPRWCVGSTTNLVLNCLDKHTGEAAARPAIVWEGEEGQIRRWSYGELNAETCRLAAGLAALGLKKGEMVGIYMPMVPETAAAFFAVAKLGCIATPLFSGFGAAAITSRLSDGAATAVITVDGSPRRGRPVAMKPIIDEAAAGVPSLRHVVVLRQLGLDVATKSGRDVWWHDLTADQTTTMRTLEVGADHPLMLVYTSGTTGKPKGTVHTHCGFPIKTALDFELCFDLKRADRLLWMSDMGWLVGPIQITATALSGATLVMAEGAPDYPEPDRLWRLVEKHQVTLLGIGPTLARTMRRHGDGGLETRDLRSLRLAASTGEPWDQESWMWVYRKVLGSRAPLMNYSGGTEVGGILATNILYPMKPCSFHGPIPGTGADIVNAEGQSVGPGEVGELVMREPSIGTTRSLWQDRERYLDSYWRKMPGLWVHGDWASRDHDGSWYIHGRSDDTIKIAGKRTGPAEIEDLLLGTGAVGEAAAVGVPDPIKGAAVVCVVVPARGQEPGPVLAKRLSDAIVAGLGGSFRPRQVIFVTDLPKTRNMKVMRRVVRGVLTGDPLGDTSSLVNPDAVDELRGTAASIPSSGASSLGEHKP
jgi:acetyl-CoA synthetase